MPVTFYKTQILFPTIRPLYIATFFYSRKECFTPKFWFPYNQPTHEQLKKSRQSFFYERAGVDFYNKKCQQQMWNENNF